MAVRWILIALLSPVLLSSVALSSECLDFDVDQVMQSISEKSENYGDVTSCVDCKRQKTRIEKLICSDPKLKLMEDLDTKSFVYAHESATGTELDHRRIDCSFVMERVSECKDKQCVCRMFKENTNGSLGGRSPYEQ